MSGDRERARDQDRARFRARDGWGVAAFVIFVAAFLAVLLFVFGGLKWVVRAVAPTLLGLPGGGWTTGGVLGLLSVAGWVGGTWCTAPARVRGRRAYAVLGALCRTLSFGSALVVLGALPGRNCRSGSAFCAYIPGTGSMFLAYAVTTTGVGWLWYRARRSRAESRQAEERARLKRLRKKGKGRSRAARTP